MLPRTAAAVAGLSVGIFSPISWRYTSSATGFHNRRGFAFVSAARGCWAGAVGRGTIPNQAAATTSLSQEGNAVEEFILASDNAGAMVKPLLSQRKEVNRCGHDFYAVTRGAPVTDRQREVLTKILAIPFHEVGSEFFLI